MHISITSLVLTPKAHNNEEKHLWKANHMFLKFEVIAAEVSHVTFSLTCDLSSWLLMGQKTPLRRLDAK